MENKLSNNIDNFVNSSVSSDEGSILMSKDVHDRSELVNEGITKDVDIGNVYLLNGRIMLKYLCQMKISLERTLSKEALILEEDVQLLEKFIVKDNDKGLMCVIDLSHNMVEHVVHQIQSGLELSIIEDDSYLHGFQVKDYTNDS